MKKLIPLLIIGILVFSGFGTSANINDKKSNNLQIKRDFQNNIMINGDELDQYQLEMEDYYIYIGREPDIPYQYCIVAQEFIPTKRILTRVELLVSKDAYTTYDLTVAIRDDLTGPDLTSISKNSESIPTGDFTWIEFDFDDIQVIPGFKYYIVCSTVDAPNNRYKWGLTIYNLYPNGSIYWSEDGQEWYFDTGVDTTFKTYGFNNLPPSAPIIDGPNTGKAGVELCWTFHSTDPEGDDVYYYIDWGDGTNSGCIGPYPSCTPVEVCHTYNETGIYIIRVKAKDIYNTECDWAEFEVTIPRNKATTNIVWYHWFLERFPMLERLLGLIRAI